MKSNKTYASPKVNQDYDDVDEVMNQQQLGFFVNSKTFNQYTVTIDEDFIHPSYYRSVCNMLDHAQEGDEVIFKVSSRGGQLSGLQVLLEAIKSTEAHTVALIVGQCASAASIFVLHCDDVVVTDSADFLIHNVSYGTAGKGSDVLAHVAHVAKTSEKMIRSTYEHFLSEDEITEVLNGKELYFDSDEVRARLEQREELRDIEEQLLLEEMKAQQEALDNPKVSPKPKATKKTTPKKA